MDENNTPAQLPAPPEAFEPLPAAAHEAALRFAAGVAAAGSLDEVLT